jgi:hypothetical protein
MYPRRNPVFWIRGQKLRTVAKKWEGVAMKGPEQPGVTVILEDAYKQNTVYRPWKDITSSDKMREDPSLPRKSAAPDFKRTATR